MVVFSLFAILVERLALQQRQLSHKVKILEGMLPICCVCKKIRTGSGNWQQMEMYISDHSEARFSHGLCPDCAKEQYPEYVEKRE